MPTLPFVTVDVFTLTRYAGNPLAIVLLPPEAENHVSDAQMQRIADEFNLSETLFLHAGVPSSSGDGDGSGMQWRVRIFMVGRELPFAGHPTIGAVAYALAQQQVSSGRLVCNAGPVDVSLSPDGGVASAAIPHNIHVHTEHVFGLDALLALQPGLAGVGIAQAAVAVVSPVRGMNFVTVEVPDLAALARVTLSGKPKPRLDREWDVGFAGSYFYVVTGEGRVRSRMIDRQFEDPATGSAACALGAYLAMKGARARGRTQRFEITQGVEMGRESNIGIEVTLTAALDAVERLVLSGTAVRVMEGTVEY